MESFCQFVGAPSSLCALQLSCFYFHVKKNIGIIHLKLILCHVSCHPDVFFSTHAIRTGYSYQSMFFLIFKCIYIYIYMYMCVYCIYALVSNLYNHGDSASPPTKGICCDLENTAGADRREAAIQSTRTGVVKKKTIQQERQVIFVGLGKLQDGGTSWCFVLQNGAVI